MSKYENSTPEGVAKLVSETNRILKNKPTVNLNLGVELRNLAEINDILSVVNSRWSRDHIWSGIAGGRLAYRTFMRNIYSLAHDLNLDPDDNRLLSLYEEIPSLAQTLKGLDTLDLQPFGIENVQIPFQKLFQDIDLVFVHSSPHYIDRSVSTAGIESGTKIDVVMVSHLSVVGMNPATKISAAFNQAVNFNF